MGDITSYGEIRFRRKNDAFLRQNVEERQKKLPRHKLSVLNICVYSIYFISFTPINLNDMATALNIKRKNIDLPVDTLQKLSIMAVAQGKSLKNFIETILISKANTVAVEVSENPSPSGDPWFNDPEKHSFC